MANSVLKSLSASLKSPSTKSPLSIFIWLVLVLFISFVIYYVYVWIVKSQQKPMVIDAKTSMSKGAASSPPASVKEGLKDMRKTPHTM